MQKKYVILCFCLLTGGRAFPQTFNTDAVRAFWHVVDEMEKDRPLTDSLWNSYFDLYGNRVYMAHNRASEQVAEHRKYLEIVFRPSLADSAKKLKPSAGETDDILKNLLYIKANEQGLRKYTATITAPGYLAACITLAQQYLPAAVRNSLPKNLVIYINAMTFDAAVQPPDMFFGLSIVYEFDKYRKGAIPAHELHHQMRKNKEIERSVSYADSASFSIISQVNNEGNADLVDKSVAVKRRATMYDAAGLLNWLLTDAPKTILRLDSGLRVNAKGRPDRLGYRDFRKLTSYSSGHIPGFYMAQVIVRNGGFEQLIHHCDNPFFIFYLYQQSAKKDKTHPPAFSAETMAYLHQLEKRIFIKGF